VSNICAAVRKPIGITDDLGRQADTLFTGFKTFVIDLAESSVDIQISAGDAGVVDVTMRVDDFFKTTIATLSANFFPRVFFHKGVYV
jgi:hypothetical protein